MVTAILAVRAGMTAIAVVSIGSIVAVVTIRPIPVVVVVGDVRQAQRQTDRQAVERVMVVMVITLAYATHM